MTRDDIIRMARETGAGEPESLYGRTDYFAMTEYELQRFAALVAAAEREACAQVCEEQIKSYMSKQYTTDPLGGFRERFAAGQCADAIRTRGYK